MHSPRLVPPRFNPGSVWIVGAGPGDPGLLTLHALHGLNEAEFILHDALVSEEILSLVAHARCEPVGKRAAGQRTDQLRINQRLIALARQGRRVVRLKGGDPLIFGRGGEEALALAAAGVPFRIVAGISAGIGGTAAAFVPLTHRGLARSVGFVTGADSDGALPDHDWTSLSRANDVLVLYMAGRRLDAIATRLLAAGRDPDDGVAIIRDATRPDQSVHVTTLARAADPSAMGASAGTATGTTADAPTLIVIGPVVALRDRLGALGQATPMTVRHDAVRLAS